MIQNLICPHCKREHSPANENEIGGICEGCGKLFYRCPKCNGYKWQTKVKDKAWQCNNCGLINAIDGFDISSLKTENIIKEFKVKSKLSLLQRLLKWLLKR